MKPPAEVHPPLVSILIAAYNSERFIKETVDSALAQTWPNFEVIVVDDASTDRTGEIVKRYANPRIRYVRHDRNEGIIGSRNDLLRMAKGEFLTWLDSDDIYMPDKIKEEAEFLVAHPEYAAVYCGMKYFFDGQPGKFYRHEFTFYSGDIFEKLLDRMFITNTAFMMRRSVVESIGMFSMTTGMVEDWEYFLRMARHGMQFGFLEKDLVEYRVRWDSNTNFANQCKIYESLVAIFKNLRATMSEAERVRFRIDERISQKEIRLAIAYLGSRDKKKFRDVWRSAKKGIAWKIFSYAVFTGVAFVPRVVISRILEKMWNRNKRSHFVPMSS